MSRSRKRVVHVPDNSKKSHAQSTDESEELAGALDQAHKYTEEEIDYRMIEHETLVLLESIDVVGIQKSVKRLTEQARELAHIREIVTYDLRRLDEYAPIVDSIIRGAYDHIKLISEQLIGCGFIDFIEDMRLRGDVEFLQIGRDSLPNVEIEFIESLAFGEQEKQMIWNILDVLLLEHRHMSRYFNEFDVDGREKYVKDVLAVAADLIENSRHFLDQKEGKGKRSALAYMSGVGKIVSGAGIIGVNVLGYVSTMGLVVGSEALLASTFTGGSRMLDGAKDVRGLM